MFAIPYILKRSQTRRRSISIRITPEKEVLICAPSWVSRQDIERFLSSKSAWIKEQLALVRHLPGKRFEDGEHHLYFGEAFPLKITLSKTASKSKLTLLYNQFEALLPDHLPATKHQPELKKLFTNWYLRQGKKIISQKVDHFCRQLGVSCNKITLKRVSSIWGSCSRKNNLNFNRKLIQAPHAIVDYVIIHEVCHLLHRHHQRSFWDQVRALDPAYKEHIKWLKQNSHLLTI